MADVAVLPRLPYLISAMSGLYVLESLAFWPNEVKPQLVLIERSN